MKALTFDENGSPKNNEDIGDAGGKNIAGLNPDIMGVFMIGTPTHAQFREQS